MILCVDPDPAARERTRDAFAETGFDTRESASFADAVDVIQSTSPEGLVTEHDLPDGTGLELVRRVRETSPDATCVLFTDVPIDDIDTAAFGDTVAEYLRKDAPDAREELVALVEHSLSMLSQTAYPLPDDEEARVAALERYAADPAELGATFDRLAELATELFGVDAAGIGLIDAHHERFLSCHGVSLGTLDREDTVCTYTILDEEPTVIEDVREDPRFADNEGLADAGIRFYAGAPLVTPEGRAIGSFCLYDDAPRELSASDRELLEMFADEAIEQLTLRRRLREAEGGER